MLVHEVIAREWVETLFPEPRSEAAEALIQHLLHSHTTIEDVGPVAEAGGVSTLVLNQLVPGHWREAKFRRAQANFSGRVIVGRDLDVVGAGKRRR